MPAQQGAGTGPDRRCGWSRAPALSRDGVRPGGWTPAQVRAMFDRIAGVYDLMNTVMTAGLHHRWRARAAELAHVGPGSRVLDVATGTGDLAIELARRVSPGGEVVGCDFSRGDARARPDKARSRAARQRCASSGPTRSRCPTPTTASTRRPSASARATSPTWRAAWPRWRASCAPAGASWCSRSRPPRDRRWRSSTRCGSTASCPLLGRLAGALMALRRALGRSAIAGGDRRRLHLPAELGQALSRARARWPRRWSGRAWARSAIC